MTRNTGQHLFGRAGRGDGGARRSSARAGRRAVYSVFLLVLLVAGAWGALSGAVVPELIAMIVP